MTKRLKTGILAGLTVFTLSLCQTDMVSGSQTEPVISFSFDENDENLTPVTNTEDALTDITDFNGYTFTEGQKGNCLYMDGSFGLKLNTTQLNTKDYTISFWVKPSEINAHTPILSIVRGEFSETNYTTVLVDENWLQPNITSIYTDDNGSSSYSCGVSGALTPDTWTHIAIVVDSSASDEDYFDKMLLYIDGEYVCDGLVLKNLCDGLSDFLLGINSSAETFNGYIDELYIFDNALSAEEISAVYNNNENTEDGKNHNGHGHGFSDNKDNNENPEHNNTDNNTQSGNIFDDIVKIDQGSLPDDDNSSLSSYLNPGLAAGMEYKTDAYSDIALIFSIILALISLCCFFTYIKKKRNQY